MSSKEDTNQISMKDLSSPKTLAVAVIFFAGIADQNGIWSNNTGVWKDELNSSEKQWTIQADDNGGMEAFPTRELPDAGAADSCPTTYNPNGDNVDIYESGNHHVVSKQEILDFINGKYKLPNGQNSDNSVVKVKEIANVIEIKQETKESSKSSGQIATEMLIRRT